MDGTISNPMEENAAFDRKEFDWHSIATDIAEECSLSHIRYRRDAEPRKASARARSADQSFSSTPGRQAGQGVAKTEPACTPST